MSVETFDSEDIILYHLIFEPEQYGAHTFGELTAACFSKDICRDIFSWCAYQHERGEPYDYMLLSQVNMDWFFYASELMQGLVQRHFSYLQRHSKVVKDRYGMRVFDRMVQQIHDARQNAESYTDLEELWKIVDATRGTINRLTGKNRIRSIGEIVAAEGNLETYEQMKTAFAKTGITNIDKKVLFKKGTWWLLRVVPGWGKPTLRSG